MKKQITTAIAFMMLALSANASPPTPASLDGQWALTERVCTDGQPPFDRFQVGRDTMELTITGNLYEAQSLIENKLELLKGTISLKYRQIQFQSSSGKTTKLIFHLSNSNELILFSAGFKENGSCAQGEGLMNILKKK